MLAGSPPVRQQHPANDGNDLVSYDSRKAGDRAQDGWHIIHFEGNSNPKVTPMSNHNQDRHMRYAGETYADHNNPINKTRN